MKAVNKNNGVLWEIRDIHKNTFSGKCINDPNDIWSNGDICTSLKKDEHDIVIEWGQLTKLISAIDEFKNKSKIIYGT